MWLQFFTTLLATRSSVYVRFRSSFTYLLTYLLCVQRELATAKGRRGRETRTERDWRCVHIARK